MPLLDFYGMDKGERRQRQAFLGIGEQDSENVRNLPTAFASYGREFAERFCQHLLADPHTA